LHPSVLHTHSTLHLRSDSPGDRPASYKSHHRQSCCPSASAGYAIRFLCPSSSGSPLRHPSCPHSGIDRISLVWFRSLMHSTNLPPSTYWKHHFGILTENKVSVFRFIEDRIFDKKVSSLKSRNRGKWRENKSCGKDGSILWGDQVEIYFSPCLTCGEPSGISLWVFVPILHFGYAQRQNDPHLNRRLATSATVG
jgi:hypothetical protein